METPDWTTACPDWADRLRKGKSIIPAPIFPQEAEEALQVFKGLKIVDALHSPTFGEASAQWVFDLVAAIFGSYDADSGRRLIREVFVLVPKKNSKSTIAAGVMTTALIRNWRASAALTILAPTVEVAKNSFDPARDMVNHDPFLRIDKDEGTGLVQVQTHVKTLTHTETQATLKIVAADAETVGGSKGVWVLVDELWIFGKKSGSENMLVEATGGLTSRKEGVVIYLTTQSDEPPAGIFKQKLDYARGVRDGTIHDPQFLPVIYEFPLEMIERGDHKKPENFHMVNPNWGRSVDEPTILRELQKAEIAGETAMRGFLAKHLNVEIGLNLRNDRWRGAEYWERNSDGMLSGPDGLAYLIENCEVIAEGIDGGGLDDLLGLSFVGRRTGSEEWLSWSHAWMQRSVLDLRKSEASVLLGFEEDGDLTIVDFPGEDAEGVANFTEQVEESGLLDLIGVDTAGITDVVDAITNRGISFDRIRGITQGFKMQGQILTAERKLKAGMLKHGGTRLMAYAVGNAKIEQRGNAVIMTKQAAGRGKIDPLMALFDAVALMGMNPKPRKKRFQVIIV